MKRHLTFSNVVAVLALFIALGGTSIAASRYVITSKKQIKPSVVKQLRGAAGPRGAAGAVGLTGAPGAAGTAGAKGDTGAAGAAGAKGDTGAKGAACLSTDPACKGPKGDTGAPGSPVAFYTRSTQITTPPVSQNNGVVLVTVGCDAGDVVTGGGFDQDAPSVQHIVKSAPTSDGTGWTVRVDSTGNSSFTGRAWARCADLP